MNNNVPVFRIIKPGIYSAFQDLGRFGYRHLGVPWSGAMDRLSYLYVNQRLGNYYSEPIIEILGQGFTIEVLQKVSVFWAGAQTVFDIDNNTISNPDTLVTLEPGQIVTLIKQSQGIWTYFGVKSGFHVDKIMGSASTLNGTHLTSFKKFDKIHQKITPIDNICQHSLRPHVFETNLTLKVNPGPEFDWLKSEHLHQIINASYFISKDCNRMGFRLFGSDILLENNRQCITSPVLPGTVQLLPNGQLIVLMRECQTTGGYPRILQLEEFSISKLAQKKSGDSLKFELV